MKAILLLLSTLLVALCAPTTDAPAEKKPVCAKNAEWRECTNICGEKSCENMMTVSACFSLRCGQPGCVCKEGFVRLDSNDEGKGCTKRETCRKLQALADAKEKGNSRN